MSTNSHGQVWSLSTYTPTPIPHDTFLPLRAVSQRTEVSTVTEWIEIAEHEDDAPVEPSVYDDLRPDVLADERIPATYGQDLTGWYVLREILDDLRNERVLI